MSWTIPFVKMHGAGNDFVLIDDRGSTFPTADVDLIRVIADRRLGVGCEGVILVQRSERCDFRMRFFNPDGSEADLCGNGARCVAAFAREIGAATADDMVFETAAGDVRALVVDSHTVRVAMPPPRKFGKGFVVVGVPHRIVPVADLAAVDVAAEGRRIRYDAAYAPEGTNVDFVVYRRPDEVAIRTYERGVEAESGACGTGSVASAVIGVRDYELSFPVKVMTFRGDELVVDGKFDGVAFSDLSLTGPVRRVFEGRLTIPSVS